MEEEESREEVVGTAAHAWVGFGRSLILPRSQICIGNASLTVKVPDVDIVL